MIREVLQDSGYEKVDVVAHSMGGLLVREYMQSNEYAHDIDKFVMLGTPNQGSSNTYIIEEGGDTYLVDQLSSFWGAYFDRTFRNQFSNSADHV